MQKTTFPFEVLVHDDASTDGTACIIKEYEKKFPDIILPIYQEENQYSKDSKIWINHQYPIARGKYIAFCEGDDFWSDVNKLQKQYEALEKHPECSLCTHKVHVLSNGKKWVNDFPPVMIERTIITPKEYIEIELGKGKWLFQTSSYFARAKYLKELVNHIPEFMSLSKASDIVTVLYLLTKGNVYYIKENMSCYRLEAAGSVSESIMQTKSYWPEQLKQYYLPTVESYDKYTNYQFHESIMSYIKRGELIILINERQYRMAHQKKYQEYLKEFPIKIRFHIALCAFFPFLDILFQIREKFIMLVRN